MNCTCISFEFIRLTGLIRNIAVYVLSILWTYRQICALSVVLDFVVAGNKHIFVDFFSEALFLILTQMESDSVYACQA